MTLILRSLAYFFKKPIIRFLLRGNAEVAWQRIRPILAQSKIVWRGVVGSNPYLPFEYQLLKAYIEKYEDARYQLQRGLEDPDPYIVGYSIVGIDQLPDKAELIAPYYDSILTRTENIESRIAQWAYLGPLNSLLKMHFRTKPS